MFNVPPTKVSELSNKMRIATEESYGETATIGVFIDAGSAFENEKNNGVAHFLEHMAFKGTKSRTKEALEVEIENMGGQLNAYTSREQTVYYCKVFKNDVPKAIDILSDILLNSKYDNSYIEAERSTILREAEEVAKDKSEVIFDYLHAGAYQGTPLSRTILGPEENIRSIRREDLINYVNTHYTAPRMVLAAAGAIKHDEIKTLAEKAFSALPKGDGKPIVRPPVDFTGCLINERDDTLNAAHVAVAMEGVDWSHPDYYVLMVIQTMLGNWDRSIGGGKNLSSNLCEAFAINEYAHSLLTFNTCYNKTGLFGTYIVFPPDGEKIMEGMRTVFNEFGRLGSTVTDHEVDIAKDKLKASVLMQLDGTTAVCEDIGRQLLTHGRRLSPAEVWLRIDAITAEDVKRVARERFEDAEPAVAAIGSTLHLPDYNWLRGWTNKNRIF